MCIRDSHGSVRALQRVECASALSAGVNMILEPSTMRGNAIAGVTSVRGRSHTFDVRADGYARGEAIDAVACRLEVGRAVTTAGSAVRQDGRSASLTAPNGQAQQALLRAAMSDADVGAAALSRAAAHGTGTALGDPIEAGSLAGAVLSSRGDGSAPPVIGSVKANSGHAEQGAGLSGLLMLAYGLAQGAAPRPRAG